MFAFAVLCSSQDTVESWWLAAKEAYRSAVWSAPTQLLKTEDCAPKKLPSELFISERAWVVAFLTAPVPWCARGTPVCSQGSAFCKAAFWHRVFQQFSQIFEGELGFCSQISVCFSVSVVSSPICHDHLCLLLVFIPSAISKISNLKLYHFWINIQHHFWVSSSCTLVENKEHVITYDVT